MVKKQKKKPTWHTAWECSAAGNDLVLIHSVSISVIKFGTDLDRHASQTGSKIAYFMPRVWLKTTPTWFSVKCYLKLILGSFQDQGGRQAVCVWHFKMSYVPLEPLRQETEVAVGAGRHGSITFGFHCYLKSLFFPVREKNKQTKHRFSSTKDITLFECVCVRGCIHGVPHDCQCFIQFSIFRLIVELKWWGRGMWRWTEGR